MMNFWKILFVAITFGTAISSCRKNAVTDDKPLSPVSKMTDLKVPDGFNWKSTREVTFNITINDDRFGNLQHVVALYDSESKLITKGAAKPGKPFESKANLLRNITEVYISCTAPDGSQTTQKMQIVQDKVNSTIEKTSKSISPKYISKIKTDNGPDCTSGCDELVQLTSNDKTVTISDGKTFCVSGSNKTLKVAFTQGGGTLRLCGTNLTIEDLSDNKINDPMKIVVSSGSSVTFDGKNKKATNFNQNNNTFENYGTVNFVDGINLAGIFTNNGTINVTGEYSTETQTSPQTVHTNNGTINVNGLLDVGSNSLFYNNGSIKTTDLRVFNHAIFYNYCKLWVTNEYDHSTTMKNYSYIKVDGKTFINGSSELAEYDGAQLSTNDIKINGTIKGYGSTSLVKVTNDTEFTGAGLITGTLQYCDANGLEKNLGTINGGAALACSVYIATNSCNTEGNGAVIIPDSDGDGLSDNQDEYPTDPTKAFDNYVATGGSDAAASITFEDTWPAKGDYDLNDVVMSYQLKIITNSQNIVVGVEGVYTLTARGGIFHNGFGIEFPISRGSVSNVSGAVLEEGQSKAVLILFTNMHAQMYYMNTILNGPTSASVSYNISFKVSNGPTLSEFGLNEYNPFIWNEDVGRGAEVHLPGKTPTSLADFKLFGTGDDRSNPAAGKYYVTADGFPWAISVPIKGFIYPVEGVDIVTGYLKFPNWVLSGGTQFTDWYSNTSTGYRNTSNLYIK